MSIPFDLAALAGRWQFELSDRVRRQHQAQLARKISDPAALAAAMAEVEREAAVSYFEVSRAGELTSYVDGVPYFTADLGLGAGTRDALRIEKPTGPVTLRLVDRDTVTMTDLDRGELVYRRAPGPTAR
jgi:hypothetical protein